MTPWAVHVFPVPRTFAFGSPWILAIRENGRVQCQLPGQVQWSPIWRSRVLRSSDAVMVLENSHCLIKAPTHQEKFGPRSLILFAEVDDPRGSWGVFMEQHWPKICERAQRALGRQSKFEVKMPGAMSARG